ncbi:MAG: penicillin-binding protein 1C [Chthoniobacteraceae bacterium]
MNPRRKFALTAVGAACLMVGLGWIFLPKPPLLDGIPFSRQVFDRHHELLRVTLTRDEKYRIYTPLSEISPELVRATLLHEDRYYNRHPGVNLVPITRSAWSLITSGKAHAGASTITMQLARLRYGIRSRTFQGKLLQMYRALQIERHYSKQQILEAYFNLAPYGRNLEGVGAASLLYFGKPPAQLSLPEAVTLSVIPQSPTRRALSSDRDNPALTAAQNRLFEQIAPGSGGKAFRARALSSPPFLAPHFTRRVLRASGDQRTIATTLDLTLQRTLERRVRDYLASRRELGVHNAAALLVDTSTMEILADIGSANFFDPAIRGQIDGTRGKRSPGSALKPFIYALAMDQGLIHPLSLLVDAPHRFAGYNPENFDREFAGPIRATDALVRSRNLPAITLAARLAHPRFYEWLKTAGIDLPHEEPFYGLTLALGGAEVTLEDLARLYGALANDGKLHPLQRTLPYLPNPGTRAFSPESAFLTLEMLKTNGRVSPGAENAEEPVYWKTGTSNGFHDAWTVAIFGHYLVAVWMGNFDGRANPAFVGRSCAAPLAFQIIDSLRATHGLRWRARQPPPGANLRKVDFCAVSGQLPLDGCKDRVTGWFIPGITPISTCSIDREVLVDAETGLRVAVDDGTHTLKREVYEFWPSNLLELFERAGLPRRLPPPFLPGCGPESIAANAIKGQALRIVSPQPGQSYAIRAGGDDHRKLALKAEADTGVARLYWFADKQFLGTAAPGEAFPWKPSPGRYSVTAVDDHGRSDSVPVLIQAVEGQ